MRMLFLAALICCYQLSLWAQEEVEALMQALPAAPQVAPDAIDPSKESWQDFAPGIRFRTGAVLLSATVLYDQGPTDGLEVLACLPGGKTHEALLQLDADNGTALKAALIALLDLPGDGLPSAEGSGQPPRGHPLQVRLRWKPEPLLEPDTILETDLSRLVRNRLFDRGYPCLPFVYTGSRIENMPVSLPGEEEPRWQQRFMLDVTRSVITNFNEANALLASPYPLAAWDQIFEVNTAIRPPPADGRAELIISRAELPLILEATADHRLALDGMPLSDEALQALLARRYAQAELQAVGITPHADLDRSADLILQEYLLQQAAIAKLWLVPIFLP